MSAALVTTVIPVYNGETFLAETVASVLNQSHPNQQVIIVDDGSTDGTAGIAARYADKVTFVQQENRGPSAARNRGLAIARGTFVAFLDADDLWHPHKLERQLARFAERPQLDLCLARLRNFRGHVSADAWTRTMADDEDVMPAYSPCTMLARRSLFDAVGSFDETRKHTHTTEWFTRVRDHRAEEEVLEDVLTLRRLHHQNRSLRHAARSQTEYLDLLKASLDRRRSSNKRADLSD